MSGAGHEPAAFPRAPLFGAALLVGGSLLAATTARLTDIGTVRVETATPIAVRDLRFEDRQDGSIVVVDPSSGQQVKTMGPGTNGFVRIVMRGLARDRLMAGFGVERPFRLTRWDDGRLTIADPATNRTTELAGFGKENVQAFAVLLQTRSSMP